jgi:hypothetical protein
MRFCCEMVYSMSLIHLLHNLALMIWHTWWPLFCNGYTDRPVFLRVPPLMPYLLWCQLLMVMTKCLWYTNNLVFPWYN